MALDFPNSPSLNETFTSGDRTWIYDGEKWVLDTSETVIELDNLSDVTITGVASGDFLTYNGTAWVNDAAPTYVQFDTSVGSPASVEGKLQWDSDFGTLSFGLEGNNSVQQVGMNQFAYCYNAEATTLNKGEVVYIFGGQGSQVSIKRASNTGDPTSSKTLGVVSESIASAGSGYVCTYGVLQGIDTSGYSEGAILYLGETAGTLTATEPTTPNHLVFVAVVIKSDNGGELWIRPQNGYEIGELHDVSAASPTTGDFLKYDGSSWVNDAINLGTDTTGNYVSDVTAGTGVTVTHTPGEGSSASVEIDDSVVVTVDGVQTLTNKTLASPVITDGEFQDTFTIGSQVFYEQSTNGFSVNEDFDASNSSTQTAYHYTSGAGRETVVFTVARTGQFTNGFGIYGTSGNNSLVNFGEAGNTKWEWRNGVGIQPVDVDGGNLRMSLSSDGVLSINNAFSLPNSDGTANQVLTTDGSGSVSWANANSGVPTGAIMQFSAASAPTDWLICDGTAVSRTTYAALFAVIGTTYGAGDGSTTFALPNLQGKVPVGYDSSQTEFDSLGETGGAKTHTLTTSEMPSHTHTQDAHGHTGTALTAGEHTHTTNAAYNTSGMGPAGAYAFYHYVRSEQSSSAGSHSHTLSINNATATNQNTGGGQAHNNLQPYIVLNYIIKT